MARGLIKHLKKLNAPKKWMLGKLSGEWAPRPSTGPHKLRECLPLSLILRNRLKYALTRRETNIIVVRRNVLVDGKVRTDLNYPAGLMDVVSIPTTNDNFRLMYDVKGRFVLHRIDEKEVGYKICRVKKVAVANKTTIGRNPFQTGQRAAIPYIVTHDARTIRFADPNIKVNDTVKIDLTTGKVTEHLPFKVGNLVMVTGGKNVGRIGVLIHVHKHPGSFTVAEVKDKRGHKFATRLENVFAIGVENEPWVSLPRGGGIKKTPLEKQQAAQAAAKKKAIAAQANQEE